MRLLDYNQVATKLSVSPHSVQKGYYDEIQRLRFPSVGGYRWREKDIEALIDKKYRSRVRL